MFFAPGGMDSNENRRVGAAVGLPLADLFSRVSAPHHASASGCLKYRFTITSAARYAIATIVIVGFPEEFCGKHDAPITHRFGMRQCCIHGFNTLISGDVPTIVPPDTWLL